MFILHFYTILFFLFCLVAGLYSLWCKDHNSCGHLLFADVHGHRRELRAWLSKFLTYDSSTPPYSIFEQITRDVMLTCLLYGLSTVYPQYAIEAGPCEHYFLEKVLVRQFEEFLALFPERRVTGVHGDLSERNGTIRLRAA